jgi:fructokinase
MSYFHSGWQGNVMMNKELFPIIGPSPVCMGTGLIVLDIIFNGKPDLPPKLWAGGSCGNVLTILSYLGWQSYPVARLGKDPAAPIIKEDMKRFNVIIDFIENDERVNTPLIVERISKGADGRPTHRFFLTCPNCGSWLPRYRPILLSTAKLLSDKMLKLQCLYFDRASPGAVELAKNAKEMGSLVVFEPPSSKEKSLFKKAVDASHIVKYAHDRICHNDEIIINNYPKLVVETLGSEGLRYKFLKDKNSSHLWKTLPAYPVEDFRDAAGSGDWCSAGLIHMLGRYEANTLENKSEKEIIEALQFGQAMAALNCRFEGARGSMYNMEKSVFINTIQSILESQTLPEPMLETISKEVSDIFTCFCPGCMNKNTQNIRR